MLLDAYERRARLIPGLLVLAPIALTVVVLGIREQPVVAALVGLLPAIGGPFVLANLVRDRGVALQARLFAKWDGPPARRFLQCSNAERSNAQKAAWRADVARVHGEDLPSRTQEAEDPSGSADKYDVAIRKAITRTRDKSQFALVFEENKNYGYWRNLLAMRPFGLGVAAAAAVTVGVAALIAANSDFLAATPSSTFVLGAVVDGLWFVFWVVVPTEAAVKRASERYADRLLDAAGNLH